MNDKKSTGDRSAGNWSTGYRSTGDRSTGNWSTGDRSAGDGSTGNRSTGDWSISNYSTGHFSTEDYAGFGAFNKPCTSEEWDSVVKPFFLFQIRPTKWIPVSDMTYAEKAGCSTFHTTGGYTKTIPMKESWAEAWANRGENDEAQLRALPNFDAGVFKEISGIDVNANLCDKCKQPLDDKCSSCGQDITT